jgi:hypothetical protein
MVHEADKHDMLELGKKYNQDSVIFSDAGKHQMLFTTGKKVGRFHQGAGHKKKKQAEDYYTLIEHPDGTHTKFALNFEDELMKSILRAWMRWHDEN